MIIIIIITINGIATMVIYMKGIYYSTTLSSVDDSDSSSKPVTDFEAILTG